MDQTLEEKGFKVIHPTLHDLDRILAFLDEHFFPEEPITFNFTIFENKTWLDKMVRQEVVDLLLIPSLKAPTSIILEDSNGEIAGVKLGYPVRMGEPEPSTTNYNFVRNLRWIVPTRIYRLTYLTEFISSPDLCNFVASDMMKKLNIEHIFLGEVLGVAKPHRGQQLSKHLIQRSMEIAKGLGCQGYIVQSTGRFSQSAYEKGHNFQLLNEVFYEDCKDGMGNLLFPDTLGHKSCKMLYKML